MTLAISGSTGFVGSYLRKHFEEKGDTVVPLSRQELEDLDLLKQKISQADVVINLAGANIFKRWTSHYKDILFKSRIDTTKAIVKAINSLDTKPLFISTSAIGIYK